MYCDRPPVPNMPVQYVIVVQKDDTDADEVIAMARDYGAVRVGGDGEVFYVVFEETPDRVDPMTERALRKELRA